MIVLVNVVVAWLEHIPLAHVVFATLSPETKNTNATTDATNIQSAVRRLIRPNMAELNQTRNFGAEFRDAPSLFRR